MSREWKPGDVAMVPGVGRAIVTRDGWVSQNFTKPMEPVPLGEYLAPCPLVVIDPEDREQVERLIDALIDAYGRPIGHHREKSIANYQAALRSLIEPPRPEEPTGLGAVVEDADGNLWVRTYGDASTPDYECWKRSEFTTRHRYSAIVAVKVLSEGVTP